jgi:hypothetical protein
MRAHHWLAVLGLVALMAPPVAAQDVSIKGQVRSRYEARDPVGNGSDAFTSMRVRAALEALLDDNVTVFIQLQDVRLWGEETNTLGDFRADNFDLHQGYVRYQGTKADWLTATVGRQATNFGGQRLVGAVGWTQQGRSFDGARFDVGDDWGNISFVAYTLGEATAANIDSDSKLYGAYMNLQDIGSGGLDLYWLHDRTDGAVETRQSTLGARYAFTGGVSGRFEGSYQSGERAGTDVSAYMYGGRLGTSFAEGKASATLWYDFISGDDPSSTETEAFHTLYATNHKFYGFADLFLNIPVHTGGAGLQDMALKLSYTGVQGVRFGADFHSFSAAEQGGLSSTHFANEIDLTLSHRYTPNLVLTTGFSYVVQDDALAEIGRLNENMHWFYLQLDAIF